MQEGAPAGKVGALSVWPKEVGRMKATERSPRVAELVALLTVKSDRHDPSPLGQLVVHYLAQVVSDARRIDCPDDEAARNTEHALDHAYRVWRQYENLRSRMDDLAEKLR
jgi:hypothetical protein